MTATIQTLSVSLDGLSLAIDDLRNHYLKEDFTPAQLLAALRTKAQELADYRIWIHLLSEEEQAPYLIALEGKSIADLPLYGIPFSIKDNIDLAGIPTTAACEAFAYTPDTSAFVVQRLIDAGAIPVGKTNLDQFATGLSGVRSPWGACRNSVDPDMISGGSSSGSAVSVALGLASFSLGSDTAGSGRVPACFNNLVGLKPSLGLLSATGMVPACRSLDCISIFALNTDDAHAVLTLAEGEDSTDHYGRRNPFHNNWRHYGKHGGPLQVGVISASQLNFFGHTGYADAYARTIQLLKNDGFTLVEFDFTPFRDAARLLYDGPWVAERYLNIAALIRENPAALLDVTREIIRAGEHITAADTFKAQYRLKALRKQVQPTLDSVDCLLTPTVGRPFRIDELIADPVALNTTLGYYTNYMNLFDMAAVAVPAGFTDSGFPFGISLAGQACTDRMLLSIARRVEGLFQRPHQSLLNTVAGAQKRIAVAVCGAHLEGQPLNWQLTERGAFLLEKTHSASCYKLYALAGGPVRRPGMVRVVDNEGSAIEIEIWSVPTTEFGSFVAGIPAPLGIGKITVADGRQVVGFICETHGLQGAEDITQLASWRKYLASLG
ncbi:MAG: allophanate hydrolase [Pseudomonadota bacterium]